MLALKVASPEQDLGLLCSHARVCLTSALIPHLESTQPSESELESSCLGVRWWRGMPLAQAPVPPITIILRASAADTW